MALSEHELRQRILPVVGKIRDKLRVQLAALNTAAVVRGIPGGERFRLQQQAKDTARAEAHRFKAVVESVSTDAGRVIGSLLREIDGGHDDQTEKSDFVKHHGKDAYLEHMRTERQRTACAVGAAAAAMLRAYAARLQQARQPRLGAPRRDVSGTVRVSGSTAG